MAPSGVAFATSSIGGFSMESVCLEIEDRVARLRPLLSSSREAQDLMKRLAPRGMVQTHDNVVDFCDWKDFSQWSQTQIGSDV